MAVALGWSAYRRGGAPARRGVALAGANALLFVGLSPLFIGVAALALFPTEGGQYPAMVGYEGDAIFVALVASFAPGWLAVLVSVGLVAAAMSTIDTCANVMALSVAYDLLEVHRRPRGGLWSRLATAGALAAVFLPGVNPRSVRWSSAVGRGGIILAYFLEVHGPLAAWEPAWLADSGLGFILWGILAAGVGYGFGLLYKR